MRQLNPRTTVPRGVTLVELMVALAIAALLAMAAGPFFGDYITNARLREAGNLLLTDALIAQSEAIKRNRTVRLDTNGSIVTVTDLGIDTVNAADDVVLRQDTLPGTAAMEVRTLDFGSEGRLLPFPTAGAVALSMAGILCSHELRCPGLRVDVAGGIRLCGDKLDNGC